MDDDTDRLLNEQIFYRDPGLRLDADTLARRDLRTVFELEQRHTPSFGDIALLRS
jgi:hypothetical protein